MKHIITTAFILTLTACYPVHAEMVLLEEAEEIWVNGEIITINTFNKQGTSTSKAFIRYKKKLWLCSASEELSSILVFCMNTKPKKD